MYDFNASQIQEIEQSYDEMREELMKKRNERRDEISSYMDTQVEAVRDELATLIVRMDADQSNVHVVSSENKHPFLFSLSNYITYFLTLQKKLAMITGNSTIFVFGLRARLTRIELTLLFPKNPDMDFITQ